MLVQGQARVQAREAEDIAAVEDPLQGVIDVVPHRRNVNQLHGHRKGVSKADPCDAELTFSHLQKRQVVGKSGGYSRAALEENGGGGGPEPKSLGTKNGPNQFCPQQPVLPSARHLEERQATWGGGGEVIKSRLTEFHPSLYKHAQKHAFGGQAPSGGPMLHEFRRTPIVTK